MVFALSRLSFSILLPVIALNYCNVHHEAAPAPVNDRMIPLFEGADKKRDQIRVDLELIASGFSQPTEILFSPVEPEVAIILEKGGKLRWFDTRRKKEGTLLKQRVETRSELGLLGMAFHPNYPTNGLFYLHYSVKSHGRLVSRIEEWRCRESVRVARCKIERGRVLLEVAQPYSNHNGGHIEFGPDRMLYIGLGDGGSGGDPYGNGQNAGSLLGSVLRIEPLRPGSDVAYRIPLNNPFATHKEKRDEIWAYGFRNPWKFSFAPDGRLIVADVGQDSWEELDLVRKGGNYGWNITEGKHCFKAEVCNKTLVIPPIYEYSHKEGNSITGGFVYTGTTIAGLTDQYVFGDFVVGKLWSIVLPQSDGTSVDKITALGKWPIMISSFGRDSQGEIYLVDYQEGRLYKLIPWTDDRKKK